MRREAACAACAVALGLASCDIFHGPVVYNLSGSEVVVSFVEPSGERKELTLPPCVGGALHADPDGAGQISEFRVTLPDGRVFNAHPDMLGELMSFDRIALVQSSGVEYVDNLEAGAVDACRR
jgi:hypothetical protein